MLVCKVELLFSFYFLVFRRPCFGSRLQRETRSVPVNLVYCEKHNLKVVANPFHVGAVMGAWPLAMRAQKLWRSHHLGWKKRTVERALCVMKEGSENELSGEEKEE